VIDAYASWLERGGWTVQREVNFADIYAEREDERLYAEAKGRTTSPGLDVDTLYGQLLRRSLMWSAARSAAGRSSPFPGEPPLTRAPRALIMPGSPGSCGTTRSRWSLPSMWGRVWSACSALWLSGSSRA
jgi:hypothetical protein